ncbi:hypothetical protein GGR52DRAFT_507151 [Hypoxylon sp. FL1284]|nr:hypothetical protein GGR52DRAFT_507151 [Hypoxylon sp. FL1284]
MGQNLTSAAGHPSRNHIILPLVHLTSWALYGPESPPVVQVVVEKKGRLYLVPVNITNVDSVQTVMEKVRDARETMLRHVCGLKLLHDAFWGQRVTIATLRTPRHVEFSGHRPPLEVSVRDREPCVDLDRPELTDDTESFVALFPELLEGSEARKCVLVERRLRKHNILLCAVVGIVVAVAAGVLVGIFSRNVGFGITTSAGIVGAIAFLIPLSTWVIEYAEAE